MPEQHELSLGGKEEENQLITDLKVAAAKGDKRAMYKLAHIYHDKKEFFESIDWLKQAKQANYLPAYNRLGLYYLRGYQDIIREDKNQAAQLFGYAAQKGNPDAAFYMIKCLLKGWGTDKDEGTAMYFIKKNLDKGHIPTQKLLLEALQQYI